MRKMMATAAIAAATLGLAACGQGPAEEAGEDVDSAIEETFQGEDDFSDGAFEQAGEEVDEATGNEPSDDLGDAVNDATDGDASTDP